MLALFCEKLETETTFGVAGCNLTLFLTWFFAGGERQRRQSGSPWRGTLVDFSRPAT